MIIKQRRKPYIPKYANYDYVKVYDGNDSFIGWIRIYYELAKAGRLKEKMNKIVIKKKGILTYKEVTDENLSSLQKEIEEIIKAHRFSNINADKVYVSVKNSNGGNVTISIEEHTCIESICNICSADFGEEELSIKEAISLNITNILDNLDDIVIREKNETN